MNEESILRSINALQIAIESIALQLNEIEIKLATLERKVI